MDKQPNSVESAYHGTTLESSVKNPFAMLGSPGLRMLMEFPRGMTSDHLSHFLQFGWPRPYVCYFGSFASQPERSGRRSRPLFQKVRFECSAVHLQIIEKGETCQQPGLHSIQQIFPTRIFPLLPFHQAQTLFAFHQDTLLPLR